ncbi:hypothetical protein RA210_U520005 [Rubrivivax sp. A210]|nr:hypothetical protein RA210_U520005 [Rubrivivax sp. A210]
MYMPDKGGSDSLPSVLLADAQIGEKWLPKKTPRFVASVANDDTLMSCHEKALGFDFSKSVSTEFINLSNGGLVAQVAEPNFCGNWECHGGCLRRLTCFRQHSDPGAYGKNWVHAPGYCHRCQCGLTLSGMHFSAGARAAWLLKMVVRHNRFL